MTLICQSAENVLAALRPYERAGRASFPRSEQRIEGPSESVAAWCRAILDQHWDAKIEDNIVIVAAVRWEAPHRITYASLQALTTSQGSIEDLYMAETREDESALAAQYLRLDFDLKHLGPLLKEPQPHWHVRNREPRFALPANSNIVVGFLDFLYRNYQEEQWIRWAREVWRSQPGWDEFKDPLPPLEAAFKEGKAEVIRANYADDLFRLRKVLDEAFDRAYPLRVDSQWLDLLGPHRSANAQR